MENPPIRCAPDDPNRCQGKTGLGFCTFLAREGTQFCTIHTCPATTKAENTKISKIYKAAQWRAKIGEYANDPEIKTLTEEIGIMRMTLDNVLASCKTPNDLLMRSSMINETLTKIEKLVTSCHKLDKSRGNLLDKNEALVLGQQMLEIIGKYITDPDTLGKIATDLLTVMESAGDVLSPNSTTPGTNRLRPVPAVSDSL